MKTPISPMAIAIVGALETAARCSTRDASARVVAVVAIFTTSGSSASHCSATSLMPSGVSFMLWWLMIRLVLPNRRILGAMSISRST